MPSRKARVPDAAVVSPVLAFLRCRTPGAWVREARANLDTVLRDHASLELKAAEQAQTLIRRYGAGGLDAAALDARFRLRLVRTMSRLAREELRHFEQVVELLAARGLGYDAVTPSRYARELHARIRTREPARCVDTLLVGAIIEARSCERFHSLLPALKSREPTLAAFYASLLRSEARHFQAYLALAEAVGGVGWDARRDELLELDAALVTSRDDDEIRFHSGHPA